MEGLGLGLGLIDKDYEELKQKDLKALRNALKFAKEQKKQVGADFMRTYMEKLIGEHETIKSLEVIAFGVEGLRGAELNQRIKEMTYKEGESEEAWKQRMMEKRIGELKVKLNGTNLKPGEKAFCVYHTGGNHWALIIIEKQIDGGVNVTLFNPFGSRSSYQEEDDRVIAELMRHYGDNTKTTSLNEARQVGGENLNACGPLCLEFVEEIKNKPSVFEYVKEKNKIAFQKEILGVKNKGKQDDEVESEAIDLIKRASGSEKQTWKELIEQQENLLQEFEKKKQQEEKSRGGTRG